MITIPAAFAGDQKQEQASSSTAAPAPAATSRSTGKFYAEVLFYRTSAA
jgi:hypothetical protein